MMNCNDNQVAGIASDGDTHQFVLHWTCDSPSHYNDYLFCAINKIDSYKLVVHYLKSSLPSHPWKIPLRVGYQSRCQNRMLGIDWVLIRNALFDKQGIFLFGGWADPTTVLAIVICILLRKKYIIWTDTPNIYRHRRWLFAVNRQVFLYFVFKYASAIFGTGNPAIDTLFRMGAPQGKLVNFPYWIDLDAYRNNTISRQISSNSIIRFVSSGRVINSLKGHDIAIRSLAKAFQQVTAPDFEYVIAGTGPDVENLKELAQQLGIGEKTKILGWIEPDELIKLLNKSDVLIHPSPIHEPYGVAVIEAMAAGLIVLSSDTTCAGLDRINQGVNGFIHRAGNVDALAEQITWLFEHPDQIPVIKNEARRTAERWPVQKGIGIIKKLFQVTV